MTFEASRIGGDVGDVLVGAETHPIRGVQFVKLTDLPAHGFTATFMDLALAGFPGAGSYPGAKTNVGL